MEQVIAGGPRAGASELWTPPASRTCQQDLPEPQVLPHSPAGDFVNLEVESIRHEYLAGPSHAAPAQDLGRVCCSVQLGEGVQAGAGRGRGRESDQHLPQ